MTANKDTSSYYDRVIVTLHAGFPNDEDKALFLNNVLEQFSQDSLDVCKDFSISVSLEELLQHCSNQQLLLFTVHLSTSWSTLIQHKIASHVVQQLLIRLPDILSQREDEVSLEDDDDDNDDDDGDESSKPDTVTQVVNKFLELCRFCIQNMGVCFENQYSCQVLRTLLELIGGVDNVHCIERKKLHQRKKGKSKNEVSEASIEIPLSVRLKLRRIYKPVTYSLTKKVYKHFKKRTHITNHINLLIQTSLKVEYEIDPLVCSKNCYKLAVVLGLNDPAPENQLHPVFENTDQQFLFETIIQCASDDLSTDIYQKLFKGRLLKFALHKRANYSLKTMINCIREDQFLGLYDEIEGDLEVIVRNNVMFNILDMIAGACLKFRCNQARFVKQLLNVMHCGVPEQRQVMIVPLIIKWQTYEEFYNIEKEEDASERICIDTVPLESVSKTGSFLLQKLFKFGSNKLIVNSLLNLEVDDLCLIATSRLGGFIIQAFCESFSITQKICDAFCDKFKGSLAKIACDQWGSRAIEDIYKKVSSNMKYQMAEELSYFLRKLQNDIYGHFVCRKLALYHFSHRRDDWQAIQKSESKKRKLFQDILGDEVSEKHQPNASSRTADVMDTVSTELSVKKKKFISKQDKKKKSKKNKFKD